VVQLTKKRLGEILLDAKKISENDLLRALAEQKKHGEKLGQIIIRLGFLSSKEILETISQQLRIPIVNLDKKEIPEELLRLLPEDTIKHFMVLPIERRFNVLKIAMVDPLDINALDEVARIVKMEVEPCIVTEAEMKRAFEKHYSMKTLVEESLEKMKEGDDLTLLKEEEKDAFVSVDMTQEEPVVRFVNSLLAQALNDGASDIHVEPQEKNMRVRMRIDGRLREVPSPDKKMFLPIISRIKILSGMDIAKTRMPQDGRFNIKEGSKEVGLRVSTFPTIHGEKVVLRLLDKSAALYGIEKLGFLPHDEEKVKNIIKKPYGFILSTGPTGSGKSTTLYAILNHLNSSEKNIITVEDPVEYTLDGLAQAQVNPKAGLTFESGLRSILRQDPDIIMIGEIRDAETAQIAVRAAITGHLVLATVHTNDTASTLTRLIDMGVEPYLVSSSVVGITAQRLMRRICSNCKTPYTPDRTEMDALKIREAVTLYRGAGCSACNFTGYRGRVAIHEIMPINAQIRELIDKRASIDHVRNVAIRQGTTTLRENSTELVLKGVSTTDELLKVTYSVE